MNLETVAMLVGMNEKQLRFLLNSIWRISLTTVILYIMGAFAGWGFIAPFASAAEVNTLKTDVTIIKIQLLEQELFDVRLRQCKAESSESRQYYYNRLQEKMNVYFHITGRNYLPPECKEIQ
jgi:hypothetical protein